MPTEWTSWILLRHNVCMCEVGPFFDAAGMASRTTRTDNFRAMRILIMAILIGTAVVRGAQAQTPSVGAPTLAEVAKKNQEARGKDGKPVKVFTNDDLKPVVAPMPAASGSPADAAAAAAATDPAATAADKSQASSSPAVEKPADVRDRSYWNTRVASEKERLEQDKVLAEALQSRINALNTDFVNRDDPAQRSRVAADRQRAAAELDRVKNAIVADQKAIAATAEEARRSGVPAGWLR